MPSLFYYCVPVNACAVSVYSRRVHIQADTFKGLVGHSVRYSLHRWHINLLFLVDSRPPPHFQVDSLFCVPRSRQARRFQGVSRLQG